jgi:hypothetical protein
MQFITLFDYVLLPFYLAIIYGIAYKRRNRLYPAKHPWHKYYIPALSLKIGGAIFIGLVYQYYYGGGDTAEYFRHARVINSSFDESFEKWINLLLRIPSQNNGEYYNYISQMQWYSDDASYFVASITAFLNMFTFNSYLPTTVLFAFISFSGVWALFRTFASLYPQLTKPIAIATLFIPSMFVWGSGIFKDTICVFGLGWLTYGVFRIMVQRDFRFSNLFITLLSFLLLAKVKLYILLAFLPALLMWVFFNYTQKIKNTGQRWLAKVLLMAIVAAGFLFFMQRFANELGKYSLENIAHSSYETRWWLSYVSNIEQGSMYDLGEFSPTIGGMLSKFPLAVNVTLFRPYLWEVKKAIVALSGFEALLFLFLTLKILFVIGPMKVWKTISTEPTIQFCFVFAIIFAFAVGISSYNFGALSRYKIPCMPFYALGLIMLYYKNRPLKKPLLKFPFRI